MRYGCSICSNHKLCPTDACNSLRYNEVWQTLKDEWDYEKNNKEPTEYGPSSDYRVWWKCEHDHKWKDSINHRTSKDKRGCPLCNQSNLEREFEKVCTNNAIKFKRQPVFDGCKNIKCLPFDFFLKKYNILVELDGHQHFRLNEHFHKTSEVFIDRCLTDIKKNVFAFTSGIHLIRIPYISIDGIKKILLNFIKTISKNKNRVIHRYITSSKSQSINYIEFIRNVKNDKRKVTSNKKAKNDDEDLTDRIDIIVPKKISNQCGLLFNFEEDKNDDERIKSIYILTYLYIKKMKNNAGIRKILEMMINEDE